MSLIITTTNGHASTVTAIKNTQEQFTSTEDCFIQAVFETATDDNGHKEDVLKNAEKKEVEEGKREIENHFKTIDNMTSGSLATTPMIPETVYQNLPTHLKTLTEYYSHGSRERDVFCTGLITAVSGCLSNITGIYRSSRVHTNLYSFILAGAGSGKGKLNDVKSYIYPLHDHLYEQSSREKQFRLLIPADTSSAMLVELLQMNNGSGVMIVPEADTLGFNQKKEWGNTTDKLRQNFHGEMIDYTRKATQEYYQIKNPHMSMCLSGTVNQLTPVIPDVENGLFSRFLYYGFDQVDVWDDLSIEDGEKDMASIMEEKGEELIKINQHYTQNPKEFAFTEEQISKLNEKFTAYLQQMILEYGTHGSIVKRLGLITFRLSIIFSAFRHYELKTSDQKIAINDLDFNTALQLVDTYLQHAKAVLDITPEAQVPGLQDKLMGFYHSLPNEFKRHELMEREGKGIPVRTMDRWLNKLITLGKIKSVTGKRGEYTKIR
jgi:hypothetical protein